MTISSFGCPINRDFALAQLAQVSDRRPEPNVRRAHTNSLGHSPGKLVLEPDSMPAGIKSLFAGMQEPPLAVVRYSTSAEHTVPQFTPGKRGMAISIDRGVAPPLQLTAVDGASVPTLDPGLFALAVAWSEGSKLQQAAIPAAALWGAGWNIWSGVSTVKSLLEFNTAPQVALQAMSFHALMPYRVEGSDKRVKWTLTPKVTRFDQLPGTLPAWAAAELTMSLVGPPLAQPDLSRDTCLTDALKADLKLGQVGYNLWAQEEGPPSKQGHKLPAGYDPDIVPWSTPYHFVAQLQFPAAYDLDASYAQNLAAAIERVGFGPQHDKTAKVDEGVYLDARLPAMVGEGGYRDTRVPAYIDSEARRGGISPAQFWNLYRKEVQEALTV